jgi:hypothetical protein
MLRWTAFAALFCDICHCCGWLIAMIAISLWTNGNDCRDFCRLSD